MAEGQADDMIDDVWEGYVATMIDKISALKVQVRTTMNDIKDDFDR